MNSYSPFDRRMDDLQPEDLGALRHAEEGWYIEYKSELSKASAIAKSIGAFANTHGGWLFYGVAEKSKDESVAGAFPGIAVAELDAALQRIRQAVAGQLAPAAHYSCKVLRGPCESIGLPPDRAVICVHVPWSASAPHVHKTGQIYRRVADGSEPVPEDDRFMLDQLFRRGDTLHEKYRDWIEKDPELSEGETEQPYLRLFFVADLWRDRQPRLEIDVERLRKIMDTGNGVVSCLPFNTVYTSHEGFVGRQLRNGNDPFYLGATWRLRRNLSSEIILPLIVTSGEEVGGLASELSRYAHKHRFVELLKRDGHVRPRIIDLNALFNSIVGLVETQRRILDAAGWTHGFHMKARLINVWRTVPFLDIPFVLDQFEEHGVPMCFDRKATMPVGTTPRSFFPVPTLDDPSEERISILVQSLSIFAFIARAFGVPDFVDIDQEKHAGVSFWVLQEAAMRSAQLEASLAEHAGSRAKPGT